MHSKYVPPRNHARAPAISLVVRVAAGEGGVVIGGCDGVMAYESTTTSCKLLELEARDLIRVLQ